jgi:aldose 1-epimerase
VHQHDPFYWGAYPMLPWCGRIDTGPIDVAGRVVHLPSNQPDGYAIHGQAYAAPWEVIDEGRLAFRGGGDGWPWTYDAEIAFDVGPSTLRVDLSLTNTDDDAMPAGIGLHPWFREPVLVRVPAELVYDDNRRSSAEPQPVAGATDLRTPRELEPRIDTTWTGLTAWQIDLAWPDRHLRARMGIETAGNLVIVAARPPELDAIALEPQTHAPQGLRRMIQGEPDAMILLEPAATLRLSVTMSFESRRQEFFR